MQCKNSDYQIEHLVVEGTFGCPHSYLIPLQQKHRLPSKDDVTNSQGIFEKIGMVRELLYENMY